ncbi:MAG: phosphatidate cytidylyltransferase [Pseudonocardiales bacterium]
MAELDDRPPGPGPGIRAAPERAAAPVQDRAVRRATGQQSASAARHRAGAKAGRNLPAAIAVGLGLGALVVVPLFTVRPVFLAVAVLAVALGTWEMVHSVEREHARPPLLPLVVGGTGMLIAAWYAGPDALLVGLLLTAVAVSLWRLAEGPDDYLRDVRTGVLVAAYVPFLAGFCILLAAPEDGARRVVTFIAAVVCSDVGGYAMGVLIGRHPMAPTVSPKKSWEGFAGSLIACLVCGVGLLTQLYHGRGTWWEGVLFGLAIAVAATLGDLGESMIKRDLSLKDMGSLLPGHGGIMDRLDSLLIAAPVAYLLLRAFVPPS